MEFATCRNVQVFYAQLLFLILLIAPLSAQIVYVDLNAPGSATGSSWTNAYIDIQTGINNATPGEQVWVAEGIYNVSAAGITLVSGVEVYGGFAGSETLLSQRDISANPTEMNGQSNNAFHIISLTGGITNSRLDGFTISQGGASGIGDQNKGGGIFCVSVHETNIIENCIIDNNSTGNGGGIYCRDSSIIILNCRISNNQSGGDGGGIAFEDDVNSQLINCIISINNNFGTGGSGITCSNSSPLIINNTFYSNNDTVGALGTVTLSNDSDPSIINCVFDGETFGVGIYEADATSDPILENCLFNNNAFGDYINEGGPILSLAQINALPEASGNITGPPLFTNPGANNFHLLASSPALDTGIDVSTTVTLSANDFDNEPRGSDGDGAGKITADGSDFDIGADELFVPAPGIITTPALLDFGDMEIDAGPTGPLAVQIENTGNAALTFTAIEIIGAQAGNFSFASGPDMSNLASDSSRTLQFLFDPITIGTKSATLRIISDASNNTTETVVLSGIGIATPEINIATSTQTLINGINQVEFGTVNEGNPALSVIFTVTNTGSAGSLLTIIDLTVSAPFIITESLTGILTGGTSDTFQIDLPTTTTGDMLGIVSISSSDANESPFEFSIHGIILNSSSGETELTTRATNWHLLD